MADDKTHSVLKVARLGHPVIRTQALALRTDEICSPEIQRFINDMVATMREYEGVGLAATQVHVAKRIAVIEVADNNRYPGTPKVPLTVLINPRVVSRDKKIEEGWEGCLSVPDLRGVVPRNRAVVCEALDQEGKPVTITAEGFFARVIQHECDHLEGQVYLDRMQNLKTLTHLGEFSRYWVKEAV